ncbi:hypothetical protein CYMTET_9858, partial [Cymbomonas tetramitiformis]
RLQMWMFGPPKGASGVPEKDPRELCQAALERLADLCTPGKPVAGSSGMVVNPKHVATFQEMLRILHVVDHVMALLNLPLATHQEAGGTAGAEDIQRLLAVFDSAYRLLQRFCEGCGQNTNPANQAAVFAHMPTMRRHMAVTGLTEVAATIAACLRQNTVHVQDITEADIQGFLRVSRNGCSPKWLAVTNAVVLSSIGASVTAKQELVMNLLLRDPETCLLMKGEDGWRERAELMAEVPDATAVADLTPRLQYHVECVELMASCCLGKKVPINRIMASGVLPLREVINVLLYLEPYLTKHISSAIPDVAIFAVKGAYLMYLQNAFLHGSGKGSSKTKRESQLAQMSSAVWESPNPSRSAASPFGVSRPSFPEGFLRGLPPQDPSVMAMLARHLRELAACNVQQSPLRRMKDRHDAAQRVGRSQEGDEGDGDGKPLEPSTFMVDTGMKIALMEGDVELMGGDGEPARISAAGSPTTNGMAEEEDLKTGAAGGSGEVIEGAASESSGRADAEAEAGRLRDLSWHAHTVVLPFLTAYFQDWYKSGFLTYGAEQDCSDRLTLVQPIVSKMHHDLLVITDWESVIFKKGEGGTRVISAQSLAHLAFKCLESMECSGVDGICTTVLRRRLKQYASVNIDDSDEGDGSPRPALWKKFISELACALDVDASTSTGIGERNMAHMLASPLVVPNVQPTMRYQDAVKQLCHVLDHQAEGGQWWRKGTIPEVRYLRMLRGACYYMAASQQRGNLELARQLFEQRAPGSPLPALHAMQVHMCKLGVLSTAINKMVHASFRVKDEAVHVLNLLLEGANVQCQEAMQTALVCEASGQNLFFSTLSQDLRSAASSVQVKKMNKLEGAWDSVGGSRLPGNATHMLIFVQRCLQLLQLMCSNHYEPLQTMMKGQRAALSYNLVADVVEFTERLTQALVVIRDTREAAECATQCFTMLSEAMRGPCSALQLEVSSGALMHTCERLLASLAITPDDLDLLCTAPRGPKTSPNKGLEEQLQLSRLRRSCMRCVRDMLEGCELEGAVFNKVVDTLNIARMVQDTTQLQQQLPQLPSPQRKVCRAELIETHMLLGSLLAVDMEDTCQIQGLLEAHKAVSSFHKTHIRFGLSTAPIPTGLFRYQLSVSHLLHQHLGPQAVAPLTNVHHPGMAWREDHFSGTDDLTRGDAQCSSIEVVFKGKLQTVAFSLSDVPAGLRQSPSWRARNLTKMYDVPRDPAVERVEALMEVVALLVYQINAEQRVVRQLPMLYYAKLQYVHLMSASLFISIIICVIITAFYGEDESSWRQQRAPFAIVRILGFFHNVTCFISLLLFFAFECPILLFKAGLVDGESPEWEQLLRRWRKHHGDSVRILHSALGGEFLTTLALHNTLGLDSALSWASDTALSWASETTPTPLRRALAYAVCNLELLAATVPALLVVLCSWRFLWFSFLIISSICGTWLTPHFFAAHLLDYLVNFESGRQTLEAVVVGGPTLCKTGCVLAVVIYIYSIVSFTSFQDDMSERNACATFYECVSLHFIFGLDGAGKSEGIGSLYPGWIMPPVRWNEDFHQQALMIYIFTYLLFWTFLISNIITGQIVEAFSNIRTKKSELQLDLEQRAFISSISRHAFGQHYDVHVAEEQNPIDYLLFVHYIATSDEPLRSGVESHVAQCLREKDAVGWIPIGQSVYLELQDRKSEKRGEEEKKLEEKYLHAQIRRIDLLEEKTKDRIDTLENDIRGRFDRLEEKILTSLNRTTP